MPDYDHLNAAHEKKVGTCVIEALWWMVLLQVSFLNLADVLMWRM